VKIRNASFRDIPRIVEIENNCFLEDAWSESAFQTELEFGRDLFLVCENDEIESYAIAIMMPPFESQIASIASDPKYQRKGNSKALLNEIIAVGESKGIKEFGLEVRVSNEAAIALYSSLGFKAEGIRKKYYSNGEDAILMWLRKD